MRSRVENLLLDFKLREGVDVNVCYVFYLLGAI